MSLAGLGQRIAVFAVFAGLVVCAGGAMVGGVPAAAPTGADLAELEAKMNAAARLHPVAPLAAPGGPASWCAECHRGLPHPGAGIDSGMLNEHAGRMDCLLCHWSASGESRPSPSWQVQAGSVAFLAVLPRDMLSKDRLAALRSGAMAGRRCFVRGPACGSCHRPGVIGSLVRPGFTPARTAGLERLESHFVLAKGEKWYFPQIR